MRALFRTSRSKPSGDTGLAGNNVCTMVRRVLEIATPSGIDPTADCQTRYLPGTFDAVSILIKDLVGTEITLFTDNVHCDLTFAASTWESFTSFSTADCAG